VTPPVGILLVDKPAGPTSHDVVEHVRKAAGIRRVGHAGTLDPFASGLLLLLLGSATRLSEYFLGMEKGYDATLRLGMETDSWDLEGEVIREDPGWHGITGKEIEAALADLRGQILQTPPVYSAKKIRGEAAHRRVRRGEEVVLDPVEVTVLDLTLTGIQLPFVHLKVLCSSGTYVRALARDLGRALGVGGHLTALRRTSIGPFSISEASLLPALGDATAVLGALIPSAPALAHLPAVEVEPAQAARIRQGQFLVLVGNDPPEDVVVRVLLEGELVALASREGDRLRPRKVMGHG
jgi:tRNA pseudouridine55 synthase